MKSQRIWSTARRFGVDVVLLCGSFLAAFLIHFEGPIPEAYRAQIPATLAVAVCTMLLGLVWARAYRKVSDFVSLGDFLGVLRGTGLASLVLLCANAVAPTSVALPWSVLIVYLLLCAATMSMALFTLRIWRESALGQAQRLDGSAARRPVLVYGAGRAGSMVARDIVQSPELGYELRGFIDDDPQKWGKEIHGTRVLGGRLDLPRHLGLRLREVVLAIPSLDAEARRQILSHCRRAGAHVRIVPGIAELLRGSSVAQQIRDVRVEDLLPR
ncbi:MAG: nucleoside-diphosphate sugar epimerase/dehydratase, partial [Candidatus Krumholzibacteriia bacterium]